MNRLKRTLKTAIQLPIDVLSIIFLICLACCVALKYCIEYLFDEE